MKILLFNKLKNQIIHSDSKFRMILSQLHWNLTPRECFYTTNLKRKLYKKIFVSIQILTGRKNFLNKTLNQRKSMSFQIPWLSNLFQEGYILIDGEKQKFPSEFVHIHTETIKIALDIANNQNLISASPTKDYLHRADLSKIPWQTIKSLYKYFTHPIFLATAESYLGDKPLLTELKIFVSPPSRTRHSLPLAGSQLWHSDYDDISNLKIFVFLDDIDENCGPLQAIPRHSSLEFMKDIRYKWGVANVSHNDSIVPETYTKAVSFIGSQGSICLIDTVNCLHRGSRHPKKPRKILYATYNTRTSFRFIPWNWIGLRAKINVGSSPLIIFDPELRFLNSNALNM